MKSIYKGILLGTLATLLVQCDREPDCVSSGICGDFLSNGHEVTTLRINQFLEKCSKGDQKADLQPVADWLQNESCVLSAEIQQSCLYSNPAICFIEVVFTDQKRSIIAFSMTNPMTVKGFK
jgi:hypothetical protein